MRQFRTVTNGTTYSIEEKVGFIFKKWVPFSYESYIHEHCRLMTHYIEKPTQEEAIKLLEELMGRAESWEIDIDDSYYCY